MESNRYIKIWLVMMMVVGSVLALLLSIGGCRLGEPEPDYFQGYAEAEYTYISSPLPGYLNTLAVHRGQQVSAGDLLFKLEDSLEVDAKEAASHRLRQAQDRLTNLTKGLRPSEMAAIRARLSQARSNLVLSQVEYERRKRLVEQRTIAREDFDRAKAKLLVDQGQVKDLTAQLETAGLGARVDEIRAAEAEVAALQASLAQADWNLRQKSQSAAAAGLVFDTYYTRKEWVQAGKPVVSLLIPGNLKVRFFVPEPELGTLKLGQRIALTCDGCPKGLTAAINYISPQVEYTPPVIYSRETRSKLVFMIEAKSDPAKADQLHPGQPLEVRLPSQGGKI
ncbi:MAG: HlyD family efflux transporter periplasmic adaptor subunit [Deltaproteobacteria bacterium]|nr:HlyD family efflux transporter periplasmic adaptor subunit [Deltaproteobacteria bacterium]